MKESSLFCQRFVEAIQNSGKSINAIERDLGYPRNALHNYINGGEPSGRRLIELSSYFHLTPEYLLGTKSESKQDSVKNFFESLSNESKLKLCTTCHEWLINRKN